MKPASGAASKVAVPGLIEVARERAVARVWLNRPEQHNALSTEFAEELKEAFHALAHDPSVRVIVLGGRGASFCAGADIAAMKASASASFEQNLAEATRLGGLFHSLADLPKPVVARVHGNVFGGGVGLAAACDIVVASDDSVFALSEVRLGILPALISPYVVRRLGDLDAKVEERVLALLAGAPQAQGRIKMLLELYADSAWEEYRAALPRTLAEVRGGAEARDGLAAFLEKRKPAWQSES